MSSAARRVLIQLQSFVRPHPNYTKQEVFSLPSTLIRHENGAFENGVF